MSDCPHNSVIGDNYGSTCQDCGEQLSGFGYGGWFGSLLTGQETCIHQWLSDGEDGEVCPYCEGRQPATKESK